MAENIPDRNRKKQSRLARIAYARGMRHAVRHIKPGACEECRKKDGEILSIKSVISGESDHINGQCTFTFTI